MARVGINSRRGAFVSFGAVGSIVLVLILLEVSLILAAVAASAIVLASLVTLVRWRLGSPPVRPRRERVGGNYDYSRQREERSRLYAERHGDE
jgi:hypothetical protein